jgi:hypothetical protein
LGCEEQYDPNVAADHVCYRLETPESPAGEEGVALAIVNAILAILAKAGLVVLVRENGVGVADCAKGWRRPMFMKRRRRSTDGKLGFLTSRSRDGARLSRLTT